MSQHCQNITMVFRVSLISIGLNSLAHQVLYRNTRNMLKWNPAVNVFKQLNPLFNPRTRYKPVSFPVFPVDLGIFFAAANQIPPQTAFAIFSHRPVSTRAPTLNCVAAFADRHAFAARSLPVLDFYLLGAITGIFSCHTSDRSVRSICPAVTPVFRPTHHSAPEAPASAGNPASATSPLQPSQPRMHHADANAPVQLLHVPLRTPTYFMPRISATPSRRRYR